MSTKTMSEKEKLELDFWLMENLFGYEFFLDKRGEYTYFLSVKGGERKPWEGYRDSEEKKKSYTKVAPSELSFQKHIYFRETWMRPTTDPAAAFAVLKKIAERYPTSTVGIANFGQGRWSVYLNGSNHAETPELAICLAARELFTTQKKD